MNSKDIFYYNNGTPCNKQTTEKRLTQKSKETYPSKAEISVEVSSKVKNVESSQPLHSARNATYETEEENEKPIQNDDSQPETKHASLKEISRRSPSRRPQDLMLTTFDLSSESSSEGKF